MFPDRRTVKPLSLRALKLSYHNLCSNSRIRNDACLPTNRANEVTVFEASPIRYNRTPSNGIPSMTPVSLTKTTELYEVSLVTIKRQTSYDSGIHRLDYGTEVCRQGQHLDSIFTGTDRNCAGRT